MYLIIHYRLNLGSYERLDTGIIVAIISFSFIFKLVVGTKISGAVRVWDSQPLDWIACLVRDPILSDHRFDIICFTKYLVGVSRQNLMKCHQQVSVNSHSISFFL